MSIKDLFDKGISLKSVKNKTKEKLAEDLESSRYIDAYAEKRGRFIPNVDFTTASNFAKFGLAEEYYDAAIKRIYQTYPYDGSQAEKLEWENNSTYLDLFLFENEYPRTNGFININSGSNTYTTTRTASIYSSSLPQYVHFYSGPHADPSGDYKSESVAGPSKDGISKANVYDTDTNRVGNLEINIDTGITIEFWMKKDDWAGQTPNAWEVLFSNITNGTTVSDDYLVMYVVDSSTSNIYIEINSDGINHTFTHDTGLSDIADGQWHHYAFTAKTAGNGTETELYVDGVHVSDVDVATKSFDTVPGPLAAAIGALSSDVDGFWNAGWGNTVETSFDEFRYWKAKRSAQQIGRFYRDQIGGGTNTDNDKYNDIVRKVDLGVYYKFNEGITGDNTTDEVVLDYSGRISNGTYVNYASTCRSTGSAIVISKAATKEFLDPIIYSNHPDVVSLASSKQSLGKDWDHNNSVSLYKSVPGWILEEDEEKSNNLKYLTQIIASYFDDMYLQIQKLPTLKDINYPDDTNYEKPLPFADRLLSTRGYDAPELFAGASELAKYLERDEKKLFEKKLYEVKNTIYQNIYNNLSYIQKSKGTFKSLRNFLRCFGVDEELVKLNIYSNNDEYEFKNNETHSHVRKKYVDFDDAETKFAANGDYSNIYTANAYQYYDSSDSNSLSYIPAATETLLTGAMMTIEAEVVFPKRLLSGDNNYGLFPGVESSIFGLHAVTASNTDMSFQDDTINFNIVAVKPDNDLRNVKFSLKTSGSSVFEELENTNSYINVYDNEKWNLAFRLRPTKARTDANISSNTSTGYLEPASTAYTYELYGVNYLSNALQNEFTLSGTMSLTEANSFFTKPKRVFIGANRTNFTGSVERHSDVKVSSTRVWLDYLPNETIRAHAKDPNSYGALQPYRNTNESLNTNYVPQISSLVMNWAMDNVTGSDSSGEFLIHDFASGSTDDDRRFGDSWARPISRYNYSGLGKHFTTNSDQAVDVEFVHSSKQKLPEVVNSDDMVQILNKLDEVVFTRDTTYVQHVLSVEKSMYQTISEEMLRMFASVTDFNNLIGEPVNRYRQNYKQLGKLRQLFFENVENDSLDLEKFLEYFRWIDDAVTIMIAQLIPVSSNAVEMLRNMVESHVLERNKYCSKFPTLEAKPPDIVASMAAIEELKYNWKFGHAPVNPDQNTNQDISSLWWKQRAERDGVLSSGDSNIDSNKEHILKSAVTEVEGKDITHKTIGGTRYTRSYYHNRSLARPVDLVVDKSLKLKGGANSDDKKINDFYKSVVKWGSDDDYIYIDADNEIPQTVINDQFTPPELKKEKYRVKALTMTAEETDDSNAFGDLPNDKNYTDAEANLLLPFNLFSSSVDTGYRSLFGDTIPVDVTNHHHDGYGNDYETPLQSPFTEKHVGGMQHRHVNINRGSDTALTRPEAWHIQPYLVETSIGYILQEYFNNATVAATEDVNILEPPVGSADGDPSPFEYWTNGSGGNHAWTFISGPTPTTNTGPASGKYAYCEVLPSKATEDFSLITPVIDMLENDSTFRLQFDYHMYGAQIGTLKVQASTNRTFPANKTETLFTISGQQQTAATDAFITTTLDSDSELANFKNKRFYIRFLYTAGATHLSDCAIDNVLLYKSDTGGAPGYDQNSLKLFSPTHDNHNRPSAIYTRDTAAKRPVNVSNVQTTGSSPTVAGNYLNRYEVVNTVSPEANDPWFVKNSDQLQSATPEVPFFRKIEDLLTVPPGAFRTALNFRNFALPDRSYLTGTIKNKTRIITKFSSPGGYETTSRGFLDPAHETFSVYNVTTYKNWGPRTILDTQLQAHQGQYGVSTHGPGSESARIYGSEATGTINSNDYTLSGDAARHKYHRNNLERLELKDSFFNKSAAALGGTSYFTGADDDSLSFGDSVSDSAFSISAWVKMTDATDFHVFNKASGSAAEWQFGSNSLNELAMTLFDGSGTAYSGRRGDIDLTTYQNTWTHIAATYGGTGGGTRITLYVNGVADSGTTYASGYTAMHNTSVNFTIGRSDAGGTFAPFAGNANGDVDEVSVWNVELTETQIKELYHGGVPDDDISPGPGDLAEHSQYDNLISWWRFGDSGTDQVVAGTLAYVIDQKSSNHLMGTPAPSVSTGPVPRVVFKESSNDNGFVSHMIPRTDKQTRWITGSII